MTAWKGLFTVFEGGWFCNILNIVRIANAVRPKNGQIVFSKIGPQYLIPMGGGGVTFGTWDPSDMWSEWCLLSWQKRQNDKCRKDINQLKSLYDLRFMLHKLLCPQFCVWFVVFTKVSATC